MSGKKPTVYKYGFLVALVLIKGKLRRFIRHKFFKKGIEASHARREGECARCGVCCNLVPQCWHLSLDDEGLPLCAKHECRPDNCRVFPIDEQDLADRNLLAPDVPCGYSFKSEEKTNN